MKDTRMMLISFVEKNMILNYVYKLYNNCLVSIVTLFRFVHLLVSKNTLFSLNVFDCHKMQMQANGTKTPMKCGSHYRSLYMISVYFNTLIALSHEAGLTILTILMLRTSFHIDYHLVYAKMKQK